MLDITTLDAKSICPNKDIQRFKNLWQTRKLLHLTLHSVGLVWFNSLCSFIDKNVFLQYINDEFPKHHP